MELAGALGVADLPDDVREGGMASLDRVNAEQEVIMTDPERRPVGMSPRASVGR
jgi:hypothetical protein